MSRTGGTPKGVPQQKGVIAVSNVDFAYCEMEKAKRNGECVRVKLRKLCEYLSLSKWELAVLEDLAQRLEETD